MELKAGTCINNLYVLEEKIGSGGGRVVYKAYHKNLRKHVVVKQIKQTAKGVLNSRTEADILKNLHNTYLPQVYDFLEMNGEVFTVIDFIEGESLDKVIKREGRIDQREVLKWARQLAEAMAYLHSQYPPIIHGDIKPANVMITPGRNICLIDFNVSMVFDSNLRRASGISKRYSPPEQYHNYAMYRSMTGGETTAKPVQSTVPLYFGSEKTALMSDGYRSDFTPYMMGMGLDERSDVYSMGATLYHMLTGMAPSENFETVIPLSMFNIPISEGLLLIVEKMMEFVPEKRYRNGQEVLSALNNIYQLDSYYKAYKKKISRFIWLITALYVMGAALVVAGLFVYRREQVNWYNSAIDQAEALIEDQEYEEASKYIDEALERQPEKIHAYAAKVLLLYETGEYEECIEYGRNAVNSPEYYITDESDNEKLGDILYVMGNAYYMLEDYDNAISCLKSALEHNTENSAYYRDLGIVYARSGNYDQALEILNQAAEMGLSQEAIYI